MSKLTPQQESILRRVDDADTRYRNAKLTARKRAQEMIDDEIAEFASDRDKAVWEAVEAGIPKRQVGLVGLKTTSPNTVHEIYNRMVQKQVNVGVEFMAPELPNCHWGSHHSFGPESNVYWLEVDGDDIVQDVRDKDPNFPVYPGYMYSKIGDKPWTWVGEKPDEATQKWAEEHPPA
jgi:hypothetical protein